MDKQVIYLDEQGQGLVLCPECQSSHTMDFSKFKGKKQDVRVRCPCGPVKDVHIEFRKHYRKEAKLTGSYVKVGDRREEKRIHVTNLSLKGMGFTVSGKHSLRPGDVVTLHFVLDDKFRSKIEKRAEIRKVTEKSIGARFIVPEGAVDKNLGFYLRK